MKKNPWNIWYPLITQVRLKYLSWKASHINYWPHVGFWLWSLFLIFKDIRRVPAPKSGIFDPLFIDALFQFLAYILNINWHISFWLFSPFLVQLSRLQLLFVDWNCAFVSEVFSWSQIPPKRKNWVKSMAK